MIEVATPIWFMIWCAILTVLRTDMVKWVHTWNKRKENRLALKFIIFVCLLVSKKKYLDHSLSLSNAIDHLFICDWRLITISKLARKSNNRNTKFSALRHWSNNKLQKLENVKNSKYFPLHIPSTLCHVMVVSCKVKVFHIFDATPTKWFSFNRPNFWLPNISNSHSVCINTWAQIML